MNATAPTPRQIDSWQAAEENAAEWMRHWGFRDARVTTGGADGGIDVWSSTALAQVKWEANQTGAPALQRLVGARRRDHDKQLMFFSGAGYSTPAVAYADDMGIALFKYGLDGRVEPASKAARELTSRAAPSSGRPQRHPAPTPNRPPPPPAPNIPQKRPGRGWFGRNWTLLVGLLFFFQAWDNGIDVVRGTPDPGIDSHDPLISLGIAVVLIVIWVASANKRRNWKNRRRSTPPPPQPYS